MENIINLIKDSKSVIEEMLLDKKLLSSINEASKLCVSKINKKNKILIAGNGGSAADSQHIAAELVSKFNKKRKAYSAIALTTDSSILTSISNDFDYKHVFSRQIEAIGNKNDIFLAYSTSGNSNNIVNALKFSKKMGLKNIGLTGLNKGKMNKYCDVLIEIPSKLTPRIQEGHLLVGHILCEIIENNISWNNNDWYINLSWW